MAKSIARDLILSFTLAISMYPFANPATPKDDALRWQFIDSYFVSSKKLYFSDLLAKTVGASIGAALPAALLLNLTKQKEHATLQTVVIASGTLIGYKYLPYLVNKYYNSKKMLKRFVENWETGKNYKQKTPESLHLLFDKIVLTYQAVENQEAVTIMKEKKKNEYLRTISNEVIRYIRSSVKYHLSPPSVT